jgi:hypothetical protein
MSSAKTIELRLEDFFILFFGIVSFFYFLLAGRFKIIKPPFFTPIILWLSFGFFGLLVNLILGNLFFIDRAFFYYLKEVEFLVIYFFIFYHIKDIKSAEFVIKSILFFSFLNVVYVFYQVISHKFTGEYGTAALCEWGVFPTGAFFLMLFVFSMIFFIFYYSNINKKIWNKIFVGLVSVSPALGVFGSASKTVFLALLLCVVVIFLLFLIKNKRVRPEKVILVSFVFLVIIVLFFIFALKYIPTVDRLVSGAFSLKSISSGYHYGRVVVFESVFNDIYLKFSQQPVLA